MKLSHLTIAVSVALGLAACGGSGDDAVDNSTPKPTPTPTPTPKPDPKPDPKPEDTKPKVENNGLGKPLDPQRKAPDGSVENNVKPLVSASKKVYVDRQTRDSVTGYNVIQGGALPQAGSSTARANRTTQNLWVVQDGETISPFPFLNPRGNGPDRATPNAGSVRFTAGLNNRPAYAAVGDIAPEGTGGPNAEDANNGITAAVEARAFLNAGKDAYAQQQLNSLGGVNLIDPNGQAGLIFYTGSTTVKNPTNAGNGDLQRDASIINYSTQTKLKANGGIQANPNFSYARVGGDYYRVIPENNVAWSDITPATTFRTVVTSVDGAASGRTGISMNEILFIPNTKVANPAANAADEQAPTVGNGLANATNPQSTAGYIAGTTLGDRLGTLNLDPRVKAGLNIIRGSQLGRIDDYSIGRGDVEFDDFTLAGVTYKLDGGANFDNVALDLSKVPSSRESMTVSVMPVGLNYQVHDAKSTGTKIDDHWVKLSADAGALKIYDLPYHRTIVSINQAAVENPNGQLARASNMFGFAGYNDYQGDGAGSDGHYGPFQVIGYNQGTLPKNGRADYRGKSFGVNAEGTLNLSADFGQDRASVYGSVTDRKRLDATKAVLPDLNLKPIMLSQPANYEQYASRGMLSSSNAPNGIVSKGSNANWGTWAVSFFGKNAEEVGGVIAEGQQLRSATLVNVKEVFSGERGTIIGDGSKSKEGSLN